MTEGVATHLLPRGALVYTTEPNGSDWGLPLVGPIHRLRGRYIRTVRNVVKCRGGRVVWFTDGTKTEPLNGKTKWLIAEPYIGDPREVEE